MSWGFTRVVQRVQKNDNVQRVKGKRKRNSANSAKPVGLNSCPIRKSDPNTSIRKFLSARRLISDKYPTKMYYNHLIY